MIIYLFYVAFFPRAFFLFLVLYYCQTLVHFVQFISNRIEFLRKFRFRISQTTERTSRKREAGAPTTGGIPSKLAVSSASHVSGTCTTNAMRRNDVSDDQF